MFVGGVFFVIFAIGDVRMGETRCAKPCAGIQT